MRLSFEVAQASLNVIGSIAHKGYLSGVGITTSDYERLTGTSPWLSSDRQRMTNLLHTLANGSVDALGLPRFALPAEYIAATISVFVSPINIHTACIYLPAAPSAEDLGAGINPLQSPRSTDMQLFALVMQLLSTGGPSSARAQFDRALGLITDKLAIDNNSNSDDNNSKSRRAK